MTFDPGTKSPPLPTDTREAARMIGLSYVSDQQPGISRLGKPGRFRYRGPGGRAVRERETLARIKSLVIPPAWTDVWIALRPHDHLQATGRDARGRKQYRYHPDFAGSARCGQICPSGGICRRPAGPAPPAETRSGQPGQSREKILAAIVTLLEQTLIRVGNEDYARTNHSFGLTTLRNRHVTVKGTELRFLFKGKSGKQWSLVAA